MSVKDIVSARISQESPSAIQPQPPHFGIVTDETPVAPFAVSEHILWDNAIASVVNAANAANLFLDVIEDPDATVVAKFTGKTVLRIAVGGAVQGDPAGGTSRAFVGTVVSIYQRRKFEDAAGTGKNYLLVKSGELYFEDLADQFAVLANR